jgi:prefoldin alpha subunit
VPGKLANVETVLVDVGTGFYVEKNRDDAKLFYDAKVKELEANLQDLDRVVAGKSDNIRMVEEGEFACFPLPEGSRRDGC